MTNIGAYASQGGPINGQGAMLAEINGRYLLRSEDYKVSEASKNPRTAGGGYPPPPPLRFLQLSKKRRCVAPPNFP